MNGIALNQISPNKWITNNELQYSYGWLGIKCQSINQHQSYRMKQTQSINEPQISFIFDEENGTITTRNCGFIDPHFMKEDIFVYMENSNTDNVTKKLKKKPRNQLLE
ncbi:unnamed protein product [Dracunculus medinensis]|uniref:Uncharacterized protein n=1 Tax=Dracunculus medinensis TaxID=318479 RepID=A0A0N4UQ53_DRAME|nr:unnamed protein product [Dracunculus medinensis]